MHLRIATLALLGLGFTAAAIRAEEPVKLVSESIGHKHKIHAIAFSPDGQLLAVGGGDEDPDDVKRQTGELTLWDVKTRKKVATLAAEMDSSAHRGRAPVPPGNQQLLAPGQQHLLGRHGALPS